MDRALRVLIVGSVACGPKVACRLKRLDPSAEMLDLCRGSAAQLGITPTLHLADMADFRPANRYQAVAVPTFTLQLASDPAAVLGHLASWLAPAGGLFLTVFRPDAELAGELPEDEWFEDYRISLADGSTATVETRHILDRAQRLLDRRHRYRVHDPAGAESARHESSQRLRWFDKGELESIIETAGFKITRRIAEFDPDADPDDPQILTIEARFGR